MPRVSPEKLLELIVNNHEALTQILSQERPEVEKIKKALDIFSDIIQCDKTGQCKQKFIALMTQHSITQGEQTYENVAIDKKMLFECKLGAFNTIIMHPVYNDVLAIHDKRFDAETLNALGQKNQTKILQQTLDNLDAMFRKSAEPLGKHNSYPQQICDNLDTVRDIMQEALQTNIELKADNTTTNARALSQFSIHQNAPSNGADNSSQKNEEKNESSDTRKAYCPVM